MTSFVAYIRVSTDKQAKSGLGLEAQRTRILDYVRPEAVVEWFEDHESGSKSDRKALEGALALCEITGACLVVATLDRLSRDALFLELVKRRCEAGGFEFRCADMPEANSFMLGVMAQLAQYERELISSRTSRALQAAKARGVKLGSPDGAKNFKGREGVGVARSVEVRQAKADAFAEKRRAVVEPMLADGLSFAKVADALTAKGITTARGGSWSPMAVSRLAKRLELVPTPAAA